MDFQSIYVLLASLMLFGWLFCISVNLCSFGLFNVFWVIFLYLLPIYILLTCLRVFCEKSILCHQFTVFWVHILIVRTQKVCFGDINSSYRVTVMLSIRWHWLLIDPSFLLMGLFLMENIGIGLIWLGLIQLVLMYDDL